MLRISISTIVISAVALLALACYSVPIMPPSGFVYTYIETPVSPSVSGRPIGAHRRASGSGTSTSTVDFVAWSEASLREAARDGGLRDVSHLKYARATFLLLPGDA